MNTPNSSSSGGYLVPTGSAPANGGPLDNIIHDLIVGCTGMDPTLVVPRWQPEPPNLPIPVQAWAAFGIIRRPTDSFPYNNLETASGDDVAYTLQRHEYLHVLTSFYDLGESGQADTLLELFRDGLAIPQNREQIAQFGMSVSWVEEAQTAPILLKQRWQYRIDLPVVLRRAVERIYPILGLETAQAEIITQNPHLIIPITVQDPDEEE